MDAFFPDADEATKASLTSYLAKFNLSSEDLHYKWEAYALSQSVEPTIKDSLRDFELYLVHEAERPKKKAKIGTPNVSRVKPITTPRRQIQSSAGKPATPLPAHIDRSGILPSSSDVPSSPVAHYSSRTNAGKVLSTLNGNIRAGGALASSPATYNPNVSASDYQYRPMYQQLSDASKVLDKQIEHMISVLLEKGDVPESEVVNPARVLQDRAVVVGRLGSDEAGYKQKLSSKGITIQTCRRLGAGTQVRLDISRLAQFSFFPGQIVALEGTNPSGTLFVAHKLLEFPDMPQAMVSDTDFGQKRGENPLRIMVAAGPFTTQDNLDFQPLRDLLDAAQTSKPSAVVLIGPFVEGDHPSLWSSTKDTPIDKLSDIFDERVAPIVTSVSQTIPVILVPSTRDIVSENLQFPQPPFSRKSLALPKNIKLVPNPALFSLDEVVISATSTDAVQDILSSRIYQNTGDSSGFAQACKHIFEQRRIYPVFPGYQSSETPTEESVFEVSLERRNRPGVPLDVSHLNLADLQFAPSVLITPSLTKPTTEVVGGVVCINPGFLAKRSTGGSYALVTVDSSATVFSKRCRVDIVLI